MLARRFITVLLTIVADARPTGVEVVSMEKVAQVQAKLAKVLQHASALPSALVAQARQVDADATTALRGSRKDKPSLEKILAEFSDFTQNLTHASDALHHDEAPQISPPDLEKATQLVPVLESKVRKVLEHMKAQKGQPSSAQVAVMAKLEHALAGPEIGQTAFERAVTLHKALVVAHDFLSDLTKTLDGDRKRLAMEIQEQQAFVLYMMLRQRRKLPLKAQMALLKRHQFKDSDYALQLLKAHSNTVPLDTQLLALLPKALADKITQKDHIGSVGRLAAAGSEGRVDIVSSRMKNVVQNMAAELVKARSQLEQISKGSSKDISVADKKQAATILKDLEDVLQRVNSTHDLKTQMEAMDEVQDKIKTWMLNAMSQK